MNTKPKDHVTDHAPSELDSPLMTVAEVAQLLSMSPAWVRQHASGFRQPTIPSLKLGTSVRFRRATVQAFIKAHERAE